MPFTRGTDHGPLFLWLESRVSDQLPRHSGGSAGWKIGVQAA